MLQFLTLQIKLLRSWSLTGKDTSGSLSPAGIESQHANTMSYVSDYDFSALVVQNSVREIYLPYKDGQMFDILDARPFRHFVADLDRHYSQRQDH